MTVLSTTIELEFTNIVVNVPFVVGIQTSGFVNEVYLNYGTLQLVAVQGPDYSVAIAPDLMTFTVTPYAPLLDKIADDGPNVVHVGRKLPLTTDFDNDDAFVREKLVSEFDRVWMGLQQNIFIVDDLQDYADAVQDAAESADAAQDAAAAAEAQAAAALAAANAALAQAEAAAEAAASVTYGTTNDVLGGVVTDRIVSPDALAALWERGADIAAAGLLTLGEGGYFAILGSAVNITDIDFNTPKNGRRAVLWFIAGHTLVHSANLVLPGSLNIITALGDTAEFIQSQDDIMICVSYRRNDGALLPAAIASTTDVLTSTNTVKAVTPDALAALWEKGLDVNVAVNTILGEGGYFSANGSGVSITAISFAVQPNGRRALVRFNGSNTLVHSAALLLPGSVDVITSVGDVAEFVQFSGGVVTCTNYVRGALPSIDVLPMFRNRIINGGMAVDQRGLGAVRITPGGGVKAYGLDRWWGIATGTGLFQFAREGGLGLIPNQVVIYNHTADASLAATDNYFWGQDIEGFNAAELSWGNGNAKPLTISFEVSSTIAATLSLFIRNSAFNRSWLTSFSVGGSGAWERKVITVPGDVTGVWNINNGIGLDIGIALGVGSDFVGVAGWQAGNKIAMAGQTNLMAGAFQVRLHEFQAEVGPIATKFEQVPYDVELRRCQRYYHSSVSGSASGPPISGFGVYGGYALSTSAVICPAAFPTVMRAIPTARLFFNSAFDQARRSTTGLAVSITTPIFVGLSPNGFGTVAPSAGAPFIVTDFYTFDITLDAEL